MNAPGGLMHGESAKHQRWWAKSLSRLAGALILLGGIFLATSLSVAAAQGTNPVPSIFEPHSTPADEVYDLSLFVLAITGAIFVVVFGLLFFVVVKFPRRASDDEREPPQVYGSTQIELAWTVIPVLIVVILFLASARVIHGIQDAPKPSTAVEVTAIGHQFWWEFRYPGLGVVTANELHIPVSQAARPTPTFIKLLSADTDHSFWVPQLAGKTDLIPNRVNRMWLDPHRTGIFLGQCAQYCGTQHAKMLLLVSVDSPEDFDAWVRAQRQPANQDEKEKAGRRIFETTACINCHAIGGTPVTGSFGPDLTHLMSRSTIASGAAENTAANLRLWIQKPDALKPGSLMPAMQLSDGDLDAVVGYLETLK
jgi:cytochrome c oxidase subunit II